MSPDRLGTALRDLVDDVEQGVAPPAAGELWAGGRRRRRTARLVPVLAAACVAALVALVVWPSGGPQASVPAVTIDGDGYARLTSYPSAIPKPPFIPASARPGITAAVLADRGDTARAVRRVAGRGGAPASQLPDGDSSAPRPCRPTAAGWRRGPQLTDLVGGGTVPSERGPVPSSRRDADARPGRRVVVAGLPPRLRRRDQPGTAELLRCRRRHRRHRLTEAPLLADGSIPDRRRVARRQHGAGAPPRRHGPRPDRPRDAHLDGRRPGLERPGHADRLDRRATERDPGVAVARRRPAPGDGVGEGARQ